MTLRDAFILNGAIAQHPNDRWYAALLDAAVREVGHSYNAVVIANAAHTFDFNAVHNDFDEGQRQRDEHGRWTSGGGSHESGHEADIAAIGRQQSMKAAIAKGSAEKETASAQKARHEAGHIEDEANVKAMQHASKGVMRKIADRAIEAVKAIGGKGGDLEHYLAHGIKSGIGKAVGKMPGVVQDSLAATYVAATVGTKAAFATWIATQSLAQKVAEERGATPAQAQKLVGSLAAADIVLTKPAMITASATGVSAGAVSMLPPATTAYLAYSAISNPIKTARAAAEHVGDAVDSMVSAGRTRKATEGRKLGVESLGRNIRTSQEMWVFNAALANRDANLVAQALEDHDYDDWYLAILYQCFQHVHDETTDEVSNIKDAVKLANKVYEDNPEDGTDDNGDDSNTGWLMSQAKK